jgi:hypothetical protein
MGMKVANVDQYELTNCSYLFWMHKKLLPSIFIVSNIFTLGFFSLQKNPWFCNVLLHFITMDIASLYDGVQKYLSYFYSNWLSMMWKFSCLTQFDPRHFTLWTCIYELFREKEYKREEMWCLKTSLHPHQSDITSKGIEKRNIVYCA